MSCPLPSKESEMLPSPTAKAYGTSPRPHLGSDEQDFKLRHGSTCHHSRSDMAILPASTVLKNGRERKSKSWETEVWVLHSILKGNKLTTRNSLDYPGSRGFCTDSLRKCGRAEGRWARVIDRSLSPSPVIPLG